MQVTMQLSADHIWSFKRDSLSDFSVILNNYVSLFLFIFLKKAQHTTEKNEQTLIFLGQKIAKEKKQSQCIFPFCNSVCE